MGGCDGRGYCHCHFYRFSMAWSLGISINELNRLDDGDDVG